MKKPLRQRARAAFARQRGRVRQWRAKPKMNFLEARKNAANYSVKVVPEWRYKDNAENVQNRMTPAFIQSPHLILYDKTGAPRFSSRYAREYGALVIHSIQRERTRYAGPSRFRFWSSYLETRASKKFQEQLGRIHPAEFLMSEFIYRHRAEIRKGTRVFLDISIGDAGLLGIYGPIIERFCQKPLVTMHHKRAGNAVRAEISTEKRRVKEILAVP